jgi:SAM-dependent methyltransferase
LKAACGGKRAGARGSLALPAERNPAVTKDRMTMLFFEIFNGLPRQGPGDAVSTIKALQLVPGLSLHTRVLDLGCGTGLQTRVLARHSPAQILAIDNHWPFVEEANRQAREQGLDGRINTRVGDMHRLDFAPGSFDLIWCEGAIYVVGFESGLRAWRPLLAPGGHLAVTEVCWSRPDPPAECADFWAREYPAIRDTAVRLMTINACGYDIVGHFVLPASAWWDDYYRPLEQHLTRFRTRHRDEADAGDLADQIQREIDMWRRYSDWYHYEFFVMRAATEQRV